MGVWTSIIRVNLRPQRIIGLGIREIHQEEELVLKFGLLVHWKGQDGGHSGQVGPDIIDFQF